MNDLSGFLHFNANGLYCAAGDFYLDPKGKVNNAVVSHAHADHARPGSVNVYATLPTRCFMEFRYRHKAAMQFFAHAYYESFVIGGVKCTFYPAGHMPGSAQVLMEHNGLRYLYTGDFKLQPDSLCEPFEMVDCDVLITETTFANPEIAHPNPVDEIRKINGIRANILLGAYVLGKSQRVIRMINDYCPGKKIMLHPKIAEMCKQYQQLNIDIGNWEHYDKRLIKLKSDMIYIVPPKMFASNRRTLNTCRIFASGWINLQKNCDETLFISDHADWNDLIKVIEGLKPKEIWTLHGNGAHLQQLYKKRVLILNERTK